MAGDEDDGTRLRIDSVTAPGAPGRIGMCACPGLRHAAATTRGSIASDLEAMRAWGASGLVSLVETEEFWALDIQELPRVAEAAGLWWLHLPMVDMGVPDEYFEAHWTREGPRLAERLRAGESFVLHCWAGLGRTGTIAARLLVEMGLDPEEAIERVRRARTGTIQTLLGKIRRILDGTYIQLDEADEEDTVITGLSG